MRYPLASTTWDEAELDAIRSVMATGMYTMGNHVRQFEEKFADFVGSKFCVMVNSGSSANLLAVAALRFHGSKTVGAGDEVIAPAVSWSTTYYPWAQYGVHIKFVDIDLDTLNVDVSQLESAIGPRTRAIQVVSLLGNPNYFDAIQDVAKKYDLIVIEDNCESMGASFQGKQAGTFGLMGTFSCFFSHHMSTMEGGLIVTDDEECYHILLSLRAHGWTRHLPQENKVCGGLGGDPFYESFRFVLPGYNVRPVEMSGAIGLQQLKKLPSFVIERRKNAERFLELFQDHRAFMVQREIGLSSWFGFALIIRPDCNYNRASVVTRLRELKIDCRPIVAGNFVRNPTIAHIPHSVHGALKNADYIHEHGFFVGNHHYEISNELEFLSESLSTLNR